MGKRIIIILGSHKLVHTARLKAHIAQKMNFFYVLTVLVAGITMANAKCDATTEPACKYDCPLIGKDFYGSDIACGYNLAQDWKACGKDGNNDRKL